MNLGWFCISWRQPAIAKTAAIRISPTRNCAGALIRHLRNLQRMKGLKEAFGIVRPEPGILRLDAQEEPVAAGASKIRRIENRMVRLRQSVERQHAKDRGQRRTQNGALKGHGNKRGPCMEWLSAHVDGVVH